MSVMDNPVFPKKYDDYFWRLLAGLTSIILFGTILFDFYTNNSEPDLLGPIAIIYKAVLVIFIAEKEFERWHEHYNGKRVGERYVLIWTILVFGILIADAILHLPYVMPSEVTTTYIVVLGIFAITRRSKIAFNARQEQVKKIQ